VKRTSHGGTWDPVAKPSQSAGNAMLDAQTRARIRRERARKTVGTRARYVFWLLVAGYAALALRTAPLMLGDEPKLRDKARVQFQQPVELEALRGSILDRDGTPLAVSVAMPMLHANPSLLHPSQVRPLAAALAPLLETSEEDLVESLIRSDAQDVWLAKAVHPQVAREAVRIAPKGAVWISDKNRRYYPGGGTAVALLGTVGADGRGNNGLELTLDRHLKGDTFKYVQLRDRKGRGLHRAAAAVRAAHQGHTITLTLDKVIQVAAENALDRLMEVSKPESANIVVLDPKTGEILAVANRPYTNPNDLSHLDPALLYDHAVQDAHEPGSVFKPFVVSLAMDAGLATPTTLVDCEGGAWGFGSNTIKDDHPHGTVTLTEVIKYSSNIGAAKMGLRVGAERVAAGLSAFGFGRNTNLGLPGEVSGFVRSPVNIRPIELATTSFGQGVTASALQLASAVAAIGNNGMRMQPFVVKEIRDRRGDLVFETKPRVDRQVLKPETAQAMARMMITVTEEGGTGTRAHVAGYNVAGKTGTAQKVVDGAYSSTARVSSFIGFVPAEDPVVAIAVMADSPSEGSKYGGIVSAPAFAEVAEVALKYYRVQPDSILLAEKAGSSHKKELVVKPPVNLWADTARTDVATDWSTGNYQDPARAVRWVDDQHVAVPDLKGVTLRDALVVLEGSGLEVEVRGSGRAVQQEPSAGGVLAMGDRIALRFEP
jgi:cell division protein FtsI (penicillin-binding protein 3)